MSTVILHLGGDPERALMAASLWHGDDRTRNHIVVSSEGRAREAKAIYDAAGIPAKEITWDVSAWDTPSNFTHTRARILAMGATLVRVVTDANHMPRAMACADLVYAGTGVTLEERPCAVSTPTPVASRARIAADVLRVCVWKVFGWLPSNPWVKRRQLARIRLAHQGVG